MDPSGYRTPGPATSGPGTPMGDPSRNMSAENISSMNAVTDTDISASALHSRLARLHATRGVQQRSPGEHHDREHHDREQHDNRGDSRLAVPQDYFTHPGSGGSHVASPYVSHRSSDELDHDHVMPSGMATPYQPQAAEFETLSRVPSYSTAVRTNVKPHDSDLPDYEQVMSSPPSPHFGPQFQMRSGQQSPSHGDITPSENQGLDPLPPPVRHHSS